MRGSQGGPRWRAFLFVATSLLPCVPATLAYRAPAGDAGHRHHKALERVLREHPRSPAAHHPFRPPLLPKDIRHRRWPQPFDEWPRAWPSVLAAAAIPFVFGVALGRWRPRRVPRAHAWGLAAVTDAEDVSSPASATKSEAVAVRRKYRDLLARRRAAPPPPPPPEGAGGPPPVQHDAVSDDPTADPSPRVVEADGAALTQRLQAEGFLRIKQSPGVTILQSRVVSLEGADRFRVTLLAMVHVGDPAYYAAIDSQLLRGYDRCLFELLVDERHVWVDPRGCRRIADRMYPSDQAEQLAREHGLVPQVGALRTGGPKWVLTDLTLQELRRAQAEAGEATAPPPVVLEALAVVLGGKVRGPLPRALRLLWWLTPCPEPWLLLFDWLWVGGRPAPVVGALVDCLTAFDGLGARRLAFAQILVSGQLTSETQVNPAPGVLIGRRNAVAVEAVARARGDGCRRVAVLYGAIHMNGILSSLLADGLRVTSSSWLDVWAVPSPRPPILERLPLPLRGAAGAVRTLALPLWFYISGYDWAITIDAVSGFLTAASPDVAAEVAAVLFLYFMRHGAVYYALSKWVLEWNRELFSEYE